MLFNRMAPRYDPFRQSLSKNSLEGSFGSFILGVFFATIYFCYFAEPTIVYKISVERNPKTETRHTDNFTYTVIITAAILITVGYVLEEIRKYKLKKQKKPIELYDGHTRLCLVRPQDEAATYREMKKFGMM